jgi:hypothetical protein
MSFDIIKAVGFVRCILSTENLLALGLFVVQSSLPPLTAFLLATSNYNILSYIVRPFLDPQMMSHQGFYI